MTKQAGVQGGKKQGKGKTEAHARVEQQNSNMSSPYAVRNKGHCESNHHTDTCKRRKDIFTGLCLFFFLQNVVKM